jgi:hypothetical protein
MLRQGHLEKTDTLRERYAQKALREAIAERDRYRNRVVNLAAEVEQLRDMLYEASCALDRERGHAKAVQLRPPESVETARLRQQLLVLEDRLAVAEGRPAQAEVCW